MKPVKKEKGLKVENLKLPEKKSEYQEKIREISSAQVEEDVIDVQVRWNKIKSTCLKATEETVGKKLNLPKSNNPLIVELSKKQKKLNRYGGCKNKTEKGKAKS